MDSGEISGELLPDGARHWDVGAARNGPSQPLMLLPLHEGPGVRFGRLPELGEFKLHGQGCRIEFLSGAVIDFDWDGSGRAVFDSWRMQNFARSVGALQVLDDSLTEAVREDARFSEIRTGWFTLLERSSAPDWQSL